MDDCYPPYLYLGHVADMHPEAISTFLLVWREKDDRGYARFNKDDIINSHNMSWTKFKNQVRSLSYLSVIYSEEITKDELLIQVYDCNIDAEGKTLC